jgi:hypothetical protein
MLRAGLAKRCDVRTPPAEVHQRSHSAVSQLCTWSLPCRGRYTLGLADSLPRVWVTAAQPAATDRKLLLGSLAASVLMSGALAVSPPALALTADYATIAAAYPEVSAADGVPPIAVGLAM